MKWEKWYFQKGKQYPLSEVINECDRRLRRGGVIRRESKNEMVRKMEKYAPATVVWCPKTDRGWGASPFNKNCWRTDEGGPIIPPDTEKEDRSGYAVGEGGDITLELKAPAGKFRVIGVDLLSHKD